MAAISVRDLDPEVAARLKVRAARHGRSMEAEARAILGDAVSDEDEQHSNLLQAMRERFVASGGVELNVPARRDMPRSPDFTTLS